MITDYGDVPSIKITEFIERDGQVMAGSSMVAWTVGLHPDPNHRLSKYLNGKCLHVMAQLDLRIYTTENVRYMKMLQIAEENWKSYWKSIIDNNSNKFELGGAL